MCVDGDNGRGSSSETVRRHVLERLGRRYRDPTGGFFSGWSLLKQKLVSGILTTQYSRELYSVQTKRHGAVSDLITIVVG
jgi:hypothetical protein